ncbi:MAG: hypothetical protein QF858_03880 [Candidatus Pacebacteria bacterium]|jgi:hypothetical protein|nr:hypothetical protein [bacterium]MDP6527982.1 hypothetical protein [Candidatus Paceibacterota bacterium]MDP6659760.1 hypothetical protein [Candidatus Paceibacterota bacterium]|tara:strand:- start:10501 stop:11424 length:924 start_codon:yes stop_codon:yes gene_type:complete
MNSRGFGNVGIVIGAFVILIIAWVSSGGPSKALLHGPLLRPIDIPIVPGATPDGGSFDTTSSEDISSGDSSVTSDTQISSGNSPFKGRVEIVHSSFAAKETDANKEYIRLRVSRSASEAISLSGWTLKSIVSSARYEIPKATRVSSSGLTAVDTKVLVEPGGEVVVVTGRSPNGVSFLVNKCSGYWEQFQDFTPSISRQCPSPEEEFLVTGQSFIGFGNDCVDFIERMPRCKIHTGELPVEFPLSCRSFITSEINYPKCVERHVNDSDFYKNEWRVYLNRSQEVWREKRELITLYDRNGLIVDTFSY